MDSRQEHAGMTIRGDVVFRNFKLHFQRITGSASLRLCVKKNYVHLQNAETQRYAKNNHWTTL